MLAQAGRKFECEQLHAVLTFCRVPEPKPQRLELLLDLDCNRLRRDLMIGIPLQLGAERIDQLEPAVPCFDAAGHAGLLSEKTVARFSAICLVSTVKHWLESPRTASVDELVDAYLYLVSHSAWM